jgi:hypothetical protein
MSERDAGSAPGKATLYAQAIEQRWSRLFDEAVVLSRRDWSRIEHWYTVGIPLGLIDEVITEVSAPEQRGQRPRRLSDLAGCVEQAWAVVVEGRVAAAGSTAASDSFDAVAYWDRRVACEPAGSSLACLLEELLSRFRAGEASSLIDDELDRRLDTVVDALTAAAVEDEVNRELAPYRNRLTTEQLATTRSRARLERFRRRLDLPRLASSGDDV